MDQKKVGAFMKGLRKEKGITQEALAEILGVTGRTISRWETGSNMPDLDILIQIADYYELEIREILDGERKSEKMNKELEETVLKVADYSNEEKMRLIKKLHVFSWIGVISFVIFLLLESMGLADSGYTETIASFCGGLAFGILMITVIYTSRYISKFQAFKRRLLKRQ
ncbi:MAG: helix-turn-helix domain-containing protein [Lachnospiraceae bacterium]|nr:helix-turn-helix domain-containing protein [Lachnospiraceae bacterium]MDE6252858.1 helix-turn-helix domain-containing protein [Lachnospiraceae bacterium]